MKRKSTERKAHFPPAASPQAKLVARFREQMSDFARGDLFRRLREDRHLSQEDAAHELGVSVKTIRAWEKGRGIKWPNAQRAGEFYEVDPERLVSRELPEPEDFNDRLAALEGQVAWLRDWAERQEARDLERDEADATRQVRTSDRPSAAPGRTTRDR